MTRYRFARRTVRWIASLAMLAVPVAPTTAQWLQWGGPQRNFTCETKGLATKWPDDGPKKLWTTKIGDGFSSVLCDDGKLYTMCRKEQSEVAVCVSADKGEILWRYEYEAPFTEGMGMEFGPGPHATPLIVGDRIFTIGVTAQLHALDKKTGKVLWKHDLKKEFNAQQLGRGYSSSPIAYKDTIVVQVGGGPGQSLMCFAQDDGRVIWGDGDFENSHSSPILINVKGKDQLIVFDTKGLISFDAASGKQLWEKAHPVQMGGNIATPVYGSDGILICSSGYGGGARALKIEEKDGKWEINELWANRNVQCHHSTLVRVGEFAYISSGDFGPTFLMCVNAATGEVAWKERTPKATLIAADGKVIYLDQDGTLGLIEANGKEMKLLSKHQLMQRIAWTVPTLVGTKLYVRDRANLVALELGS